MKKVNGVLTAVKTLDLLTLKLFPKLFWKNVTIIGKNVFEYCTFETINIPEGVKQINYRAFGGCDNLQNVVLPKSLTGLGEEAFAGCDNLKEVVISDGVTVVSRGSFQFCENLTKVVLPNSIEKIQDWAFFKCKNLKEIKLPESLILIDFNAFADSGIKQIELPDGVTVKGYAFNGCNFERVFIPKGARVDISAFSNCKIDELVTYNFSSTDFIDCEIKKVTILEGQTEIIKAFTVSSVEQIVLPSTIKTIAKGAFSDCFHLQEINLQEGLEIIGDYAFSACSNLKSINIPSTLTSLGDYAFKGCESLKEIEIPESVVFLGNYTFTDSNIEKVTILADVNELPIGMFNSCAFLKEVNIPNTVAYIEEKAFFDCASLSKIQLPSSLKEILNHAFANTGLTEIDIPDSVENISKGAFEDCAKLTKVKLPKNLTTISSKLFKNCSKLTVVELPENLEKIRGLAFAGCTNLTYLKVPKSVSVHYGAFDNSGINFVTITDTDIIFSKDKQNIKGAITLSYGLYSFYEQYGYLDEFLENYDYKTFESEMKPFEEIIMSATPYKQRYFYGFARKLGCFSKEKIRNSKGEETQTTKAQKRSSLLASLIKSGALSIDDIYMIFTDVDNLSDGAVKFLSNQNGKEFVNIALLKELEREYSGITVKVLNNFDQIKSSRTSIDAETGMPRTASWREVFINFYHEQVYENITAENRDIAHVFVKHDLDQFSFDRASNIRKEAEKREIPRHILGKELKEMSILEQIEQVKSKTSEVLIENKNLLDDLYAKKFTFEFLDKRDPRNFILGVYASCCATITSMAYGSYIAASSVTAPDVQNLVIRDVSGEIIGKATLYVNEEYGYVVINDFEINSKYRDGEVSLGFYNSSQDTQVFEDRELIFQSFMRGINAFVEEYDEQNPDKPIQKVNVGMGYNRLKAQCQRYEQETQLLEVPSQYYFQDASEQQYILYERKEEKTGEVEK